MMMVMLLLLLMMITNISYDYDGYGNECFLRMCGAVDSGSRSSKRGTSRRRCPRRSRSRRVREVLAV